MVIWLIGMSASGKTTIGRSLYDKLKSSDDKWIFLDGDTFRNILGEDLGHTIEERRKNAYRISRLCEFLSSQNVNVLACVLSIFHDNQEYNRNHISGYQEVFIDVEFENLLKRDNKHLYKKALEGEILDVVGVDIEFKKPLSPDLIIDNNSDSPDFDAITNKIIRDLNIAVDNRYSYTKNNLIAKPHKYQYSRYEGVEFIDRFLKDRNDSINYLRERIVRIGNLEKIDTRSEFNPYLENNVIIFDKYVAYLNRQSSSILTENKAIIDTLIKRFEVSKKLFLHYDNIEYRKSTTETCDIVVYACFSQLLQKYYTQVCSNEEKLIYLNAILKVNDIISSVRSDIITMQEIEECIRAFEGELNLVKEYL